MPYPGQCYSTRELSFGDNAVKCFLRVHVHACVPCSLLEYHRGMQEVSCVRAWGFRPSSSAAPPQLLIGGEDRAHNVEIWDGFVDHVPPALDEAATSQLQEPPFLPWRMSAASQDWPPPRGGSLGVERGKREWTREGRGGSNETAQQGGPEKGRGTSPIGHHARGNSTGPPSAQARHRFRFRASLVSLRMVRTTGSIE